MAISFNASALLNGNGIDVKSVVNAILNQQTGPLTTWQNQQTDYQAFFKQTIVAKLK